MSTSSFYELSRLLHGADEQPTKAKDEQPTKAKDAPPAEDKDEAMFRVRVAELMLLSHIASEGSLADLEGSFTQLSSLPDLGDTYWTFTLDPEEQAEQVTCTWSSRDVIAVAGGLAFPSKRDAIAAKNYLVATLKLVSIRKEHKDL